MDRKGKRFLLSVLPCLIIAIMLTGWVMQAQSQEKYPTRGIDLICPFAPGGTTDLWGRITADFLKKKWGVSVNVINKAGGAGVPGALEVYKAAPDGYTMLADSQITSFYGVMIKDQPFEVMDRSFIAIVAVSPSVIMCCKKLPVKNLKDLEAEVKKDPENFTWASIGGGPSEYVARQLFKAMGVDIKKTKPVTVRGMGEGDQLIAGCHVKAGWDAAPSAYSHIKGGLVKALATTGLKMPELYPDLPNTAEQGYPTVDHLWWWGISGPPKLPSHIVNKWDEALREISRDPAFISKIKSGGLILYKNSQEFREHVMKEMKQAKELWGIK